MKKTKTTKTKTVEVEKKEVLKKGLQVKLESDELGKITITIKHEKAN